MILSFWLLLLKTLNLQKKCKKCFYFCLPLVRNFCSNAQTSFSQTSYCKPRTDLLLQNMLPRCFQRRSSSRNLYVLYSFSQGCNLFHFGPYKNNFFIRKKAKSTCLIFKTSIFILCFILFSYICLSVSFFCWFCLCFPSKTITHSRIVDSFPPHIAQKICRFFSQHF